MFDPERAFFSRLPPEQLDALDEMTRVDESVVRAALARVPPSWSMIEVIPAGAYFKRGSLQVGYTVQKYEDRRVWIHASVCGRKGSSLGPGDPRHPSTYYLPSFEDVRRVKNDFIGEDRWAYQVFPSAKDYINQNPFVLHLYALMDGAPALPDFTMGIGAI
jgi:hypothetical protein